MRVLLLGGSTEASGLAKALAADARFQATMSLAGRTGKPRPQPLPIRVGGFGGVGGLCGFLFQNKVDVLIDATHPFASQMSRHALEAASRTGTPLVAVERPAWEPVDGDRWNGVQSVDAAVQAIGPEPRRVFCGIGSLAIAALEAAPHHAYVIRLIDRPASPPRLPHMIMVQSAGPFSTDEDIELFREHAIDVVLAKNSGGSATVSKIEAARSLGLPVIMVERPFVPQRPTVATTDEALSWLNRHYDASLAPRGV